MSGAKIGRYFALALRCLLGAVFLYAGSVKISRTQDFAYDVNSYQLTSWTAAILIAVYLPWVEIFTGMALLARQLYLGALAIAAKNSVAAEQLVSYLLKTPYLSRRRILKLSTSDTANCLAHSS